MSSALSSDLDVLKDIPGYKAILKSVLKTQIQLLIEQLADHTGEESIILTASVNDGTLSHLGSSTGKGFLDGRDEIKSQFLGFCLKSHHKKKTQEVKSPYQRVNHGNQGQRNVPQRPPQKRPRIHPVTLQRAGSNEGHSGSPLRPPGSVPSPRDDQGPEMSPGILGSSETVKIEGSDHNDSNTETPNFTSTPTSFPSTLQLSHTQTSADQSYSDHNQELGQGQTSQSAGQGGDEESDAAAAETSIKIEPITENEMELEITGVEPGTSSVPSDNWGQGQMGYGPTGSVGDESLDQSGDQSGYKKDNQYDAMTPSVYGNIDCLYQRPIQQSTSLPATAQNWTARLGQYATYKPEMFTEIDVGLVNTPPVTSDIQLPDGTSLELKHSCKYCGRRFLFQSYLERHMFSHTGERPFVCSVCEKGFTRQNALNNHMKSVHSGQV